MGLINGCFVLYKTNRANIVNNWDVMNQQILIVEDDASFSVLLGKLVEKAGYQYQICTRVEDAKRHLLKKQFSIVLSDLRLPDGDGIMLLEWLRDGGVDIPVIIMTSYAEIQSAVAAIKLGAFDYLQKPINPTLLKEKIELALLPAEKSPKANVPTPPKELSKGYVEGKNPAAREMYEHIRLVAPTLMAVLILGESGTGKEYAARLIHSLSSRSKGPFIPVDCGSLSKELAPSELFGHTKGSFTSAISDKKGVFEQAHGGTVFLDEVGNLSYDVQVQLLRALQERTVRPVGAVATVKVDVRIITATNENLLEAIANGSFREDLYHRLNEFSVTVPPLRERKGDIKIFAYHFLAEANAELGKQVESFSEDAIRLLEGHSWSGNLRELRNVVRRAVLFAKTNEIEPINLPVLTQIPKDGDSANFSLYPSDIREQIERALKYANGNKAQAARLLNIDRKTLYNKMHQLGMEL